MDWITGASGLLVSLAGVVVLARAHRRVAHVAVGAYLSIAGLPFAIAGTVGTFPGSPVVSHVLGWASIVTGFLVLAVAPRPLAPRERRIALAILVGVAVALAIGIAWGASPRLTDVEGFLHALMLASLALVASARAALGGVERAKLVALTWLTALPVVCGLVPAGAFVAPRWVGLAAFTVAVAALWLTAARRGDRRLALVAVIVVVAFAAARTAVWLWADANPYAFTTLIGLARILGAATTVRAFARDAAVKQVFGGRPPRRPSR